MEFVVGVVWNSQEGEEKSSGRVGMPYRSGHTRNVADKTFCRKTFWTNSRNVLLIFHVMNIIETVSSVRAD